MGNAQHAQAIKAEVKFAKAAHYPGDEVHGVVVLQVLAHRVEMGDAYITVRGRERSRWVEKSLTGQPSGKQNQWLKKSLFQCVDEIPLSGSISRGVYIVPFEFKLPEGLPPSVDVRGYAPNAHSFGGCINYTVKATCEIRGEKACHVTCKEQFKILQERARNRGSFSETAEDAPKWLGIMGTGHISCQVGLDRVDGAPGDSLNVFCQVKNNTSVAVRMIKVRLWRDVYVVNKGNTPCVVRHRMESVRNTDVISPFTSREGDTGVFLPIQLPKTLDPEVWSEHVHVSYRIVLSLDLPFTPDLCLEIPVSVNQPKTHQPPETPVVVPRNATILAKVVMNVSHAAVHSVVPGITLEAPNVNGCGWGIGTNNRGMNPHYIPALPTHNMQNMQNIHHDPHHNNNAHGCAASFASTPAPYQPSNNGSTVGYPMGASAYLTPRSVRSRSPSEGHRGGDPDYCFVDASTTSYYGGLAPSAPPAPM